MKFCTKKRGKGKRKRIYQLVLIPSWSVFFQTTAVTIQLNYSLKNKKCIFHAINSTNTFVSPYGGLRNPTIPNENRHPPVSHIPWLVQREGKPSSNSTHEQKINKCQHHNPEICQSGSKFYDLRLSETETNTLSLQIKPSAF